MQDFKEKKRTVKKAAVLLAAFLALLLSLSAFFKSMALNYPEFVQSRNRPWVNIQSERNDSIDVLVLGDSESYTTFSPIEIWQQDGISSFVCGQTGQEIEETYYMLRRALFFVHRNQRSWYLRQTVCFSHRVFLREYRK